MNPSETRWWWVRHAPVPDNGRIYGQRDLDCDCTDGPIFAALASELPRDAVWLTSNLKRTHQTAAAIASAIAPSPSDEQRPIVVPEFNEQNLGDWQGHDRKEFFAKLGPLQRHFWVAPAHERAPGGESFLDVIKRVSLAIDGLTAAHRGRDLVAVAHGGTIRAALTLALGLEPEAAFSFTIDTCSITRIDHMSEDGQQRWRVAAVNHRPWSLTGRAASSVAKA
jgi:alpha-ribazole phosphatase